MKSRRRSPAVLRAAGRGLVAAMAMSGTRAITSNLGLLEETPPRKLVERHGPQALQRMPESYRAAVTEAFHWAYGTGGGLMFGFMPERVRTHPATGPTFGLAVWLAFEIGIGPMLGVEHRNRRVLGRVVLALDHVLYGVVVAGRLAPEPQVTAQARGVDWEDQA